MRWYAHLSLFSAAAFVTASALLPPASRPPSSASFLPYRQHNSQVLQGPLCIIMQHMRQGKSKIQACVPLRPPPPPLPRVPAQSYSALHTGISILIHVTMLYSYSLSIKENPGQVVVTCLVLPVPIISSSCSSSQSLMVR